MKWVLKITFAVLVLFGLLCAYGATQSEQIEAESSIDINAAPEDVFPYLSDLTLAQTWLPWADDATLDDYIVGGAGSGAGQQAAWTCQRAPCVDGTQRLLVVEPISLVKSDLNLGGIQASSTYALMPPEADGVTTALIQTKQSTGGFPYLQRLTNKRKQADLAARQQKALERLKFIVEDNL